MARLDIEVARVLSWVGEEERRYCDTISKIKLDDPHLAIKLEGRLNYIRIVHAGIRRDISHLNSLKGYRPQFQLSDGCTTVEEGIDSNEDEAVDDDEENRQIDDMEQVLIGISWLES